MVGWTLGGTFPAGQLTHSTSIQSHCPITTGYLSVLQSDIKYSAVVKLLTPFTPLHVVEYQQLAVYEKQAPIESRTSHCT